MQGYWNGLQCFSQLSHNGICWHTYIGSNGLLWPLGMCLPNWAACDKHCHMYTLAPTTTILPPISPLPPPLLPSTHHPGNYLGFSVPQMLTRAKLEIWLQTMDLTTTTMMDLVTMSRTVSRRGNRGPQVSNTLDLPPTATPLIIHSQPHNVPHHWQAHHHLLPLFWLPHQCHPPHHHPHPPAWLPHQQCPHLHHFNCHINTLNHQWSWWSHPF